MTKVVTPNASPLTPYELKMANSRNLYQEVILDHNKKPRNWGAVADATHRSEGLNPLCGDHIYLSLKVSGDNVEAIGFEIGRAHV